MIPSFIITFRETLEVALVVGVIFSYLYRTNQRAYVKAVYLGLFLGIMASLVLGIIFKKVAGGFVGDSEAIFEGTMMLFGAALLTSMIFWITKQKQVVQKLEQRVGEKVNQSNTFGLLFLVFILVLREGVETVLFLNASLLVSASNFLGGVILGAVAAVTVGYLLFKGFMKIKVKYFFNVTSVLLIFFAAGLVVHGVHEFHEANILPPIISQVWDINPPLLADGSYPLFHDHGQVGSLLKRLFGYNGNPSLLEILSYFGYFGLVFLLIKIRDKSLSRKTV